MADKSAIALPTRITRLAAIFTRRTSLFSRTVYRDWYGTLSPSMAWKLAGIVHPWSDIQRPIFRRPRTREIVILHHTHDADIRRILYRAIRELSFVQSVENCRSGLCATPVGEEIINDGMNALGIKSLESGDLRIREYPQV